MRESLGKPRRQSAAFFARERKKLEGLVTSRPVKRRPVALLPTMLLAHFTCCRYRARVRAHPQQDLSAVNGAVAWRGVSDRSCLTSGGSHVDAQEHPDAVAEQIQVGHFVTAFCKQAGLLCRGKVLTADYATSTYRVQFERSELGSELCSDVDLRLHGARAHSPAVPHRPHLPVRSSVVAADLGALAHSVSPFHLAAATPESGSHIDGSAVASPPLFDFVDSSSSRGGGSVARWGFRERLLATAAQLLERKEALMLALRRHNDEAEVESQNTRGEAESEAPPGSRPCSGVAVTRAGLAHEFRRDGAWVVNNMAANNAHLGRCLAALQRLEGQEDRSGDSSSEAAIEAWVR